MHDIVRVDEDSELFSLGLERGRPRGDLGYPKGMGQFYRVQGVPSLWLKLPGDGMET